MPGLWGASLAFFGVNCGILGIIVADIGRHAESVSIDQAGVAVEEKVKTDMKSRKKVDVR